MRAEADRALTVHDLYMKYLDPVDLATYLPATVDLDVRVTRQLVEVGAHRGHARVDGEPSCGASGVTGS